MKRILVLVVMAVFRVMIISLAIAAVLIISLEAQSVAGQHGASRATGIVQNPEGILEQLKTRGAKIRMTTRAQVMRRAGSLAGQSGRGVPSCGQNACICTGPECLELIDSNVCDADSFHCVPSDDGPVCVCQKE